jgi:serine beta-lactamase-like protein LACTB, mitochondrial
MRRTSAARAKERLVILSRSHGMSRRLFLASSSAFFLLGASAVATPRSTKSTTQQLMDFLTQLRATLQAPGLSAAVYADGRLAFSGGVGVCDLETSAPQDGRTVYSIASISKTMTAVAVMQLVDAGKVSLDAPIQTYAPWFPQKQHPITVRQLLTHTSGIRHYRDNEDSDSGQWMDAFRHYATYEDSTAFWRNDPLLFDPGTYWSYSTYGFSLLQAVIETASGADFETYLRDHVWMPAGLLATQLDVAGRIVTHRGQGYLRDDKTGRLSRARDEDSSYKYAAGGILSTDEDLCRFAHALDAGRLLAPSTVAQMFSPQLPPTITSYSEHDFDPAREQAICWFRETDAQGRTYVDHSGDNKGIISQLTNYWQQGVIIALHTNVDPSPHLDAAAERIANVYLSGNPS